MSEPQEETPQTDPVPDPETEIAEQMTPDDDEKPDVAAPNPDEQEVTPTGPGPESPFQPPELTPDAEPEPDDEQTTDDEPLESYAPGVAEARLMSEREAEQLGKKLDAERKRHGKRVMELLGNDLGGHIPCPTCMDGIDGFIVSPEFAPLDAEQRDRMMQILGLDDWGQIPAATWAAQCETCKGFGKIKTGSHVQGREVTGCEDCGESGWRNLRVPAQVNGNTDEVPSAVTGPTTIQDLEPDPRVQALRSEGYMVIPRVEVAAGQMPVVFLRVVAVVFAIFAVLTANGWAFSQSVAHAVGWLAAAFLAFLLSTIPYGPVPQVPTRYTVEVKMAPVIVTVWADSGPEAIKAAPWMIGAAGLAHHGTISVVAADYSEAVSSNIGTAA